MGTDRDTSWRENPRQDRPGESTRSAGTREASTSEKAEAREGFGFSERYGGGFPGEGDGQLGMNDRAELRGDYGTPPPGQRDRRLRHPNDYARWREEQLSQFDRDYEEWRRERQGGGFAQAFEQWRTERDRSRASAKPQDDNGARTDGVPPPVS